MGFQIKREPFENRKKLIIAKTRANFNL